MKNLPSFMDKMEGLVVEWDDLKSISSKSTVAKKISFEWYIQFTRLSLKS